MSRALFLHWLRAQALHLTAIVGCIFALQTSGCDYNAAGSEEVAEVASTLSLANSAVCQAPTDCSSGFCDNTGHCAACVSDGNCAEGTLGAAGGQYCSNTGVCTARKADGQSCAASNQCTGASCYAARQCVNGCCDGVSVCHGYATGDKQCTSGRKCDDGNPCHSAGTVNTASNPHTCTGSSNLTNGASCNPDTTLCSTDACSAGSCVHAPGNAGVTCHASAGACDATTACGGSSTSCPSSLKANGTVCRAANGACDVAETCSGAAASCPSDAIAAAGSSCRAAAGSCDSAEVCTGLNGYVQTLTLTNPSGGAAQSNFQVVVQILSDNLSFWNHIDGGANATGHDIHVQDAAGNELSFWIEQLDIANKRARIWVRLPSVAAPPSTASVKLLYGNANRAAASSIDATMIFGDEFTGGGTGTSISGLDGNKWIVDDAQGWAVSGPNGGHLTSTGVGGRIHSRTAATTGTVLETKWKISAGLEFAYVVVDGAKNTGNQNGDAIVAGLDLDESTGPFSYWNNILWTDTFQWTADYFSAYARSSISLVATSGNSNKSNLTRWSDGSNSANLTFSQAYNPSNAALTLGKPYDNVSDRSGDFTADWDWALIRKYAATPPTLAANNDEAADAASKTCPTDVKAPNGTQCNDGNDCTGPDACQTGVCTGPTTACVNNDLVPTVNCVVPIDEGTLGAVFGYNNSVGAAVTLGVGPRNSFSGTQSDRGQPILFAPGQVPIASFQTFPSNGQLTWTLGQQSAVASAGSPACPPALATALGQLFTPTNDSKAVLQLVHNFLSNPHFPAYLSAVRTSFPSVSPFQSSLLDAMELVIANADLVGDTANLSPGQLARIPGFRSALLSNPAVIRLRLAGDALRAQPASLQCDFASTLDRNPPLVTTEPLQAGSMYADSLALLDAPALHNLQVAFGATLAGGGSAAFLGAPGVLLSATLSQDDLMALQLAGPIPTSFLGGLLSVVVGAVGGAIVGAITGGPWGAVAGAVAGGIIGGVAYAMSDGCDACTSVGEPGQMPPGCQACADHCCVDFTVEVTGSFITGNGCGLDIDSCVLDSDCGSGRSCAQGCCSTLIDQCPGVHCSSDTDCSGTNRCHSGCCAGPCGFGGVTCNTVPDSACGVATGCSALGDTCQNGCCIPLQPD